MEFVHVRYSSLHFTLLTVDLRITTIHVLSRFDLQTTKLFAINWTSKIPLSNESIVVVFVIRIPYPSKSFLHRFLSKLTLLKLVLIFCRDLQVVNSHLLRDLTERDLWDDEMKNQMIASNGSIQVQWGLKSWSSLLFAWDGHSIP